MLSDAIRTTPRSHGESAKADLAITKEKEFILCNSIVKSSPFFGHYLLFIDY
jgi:hypothetical protein